MSEMSNLASRYQFGHTRWSMVFSAGQSRGDAARDALLVHYHEAVYRYLLARIGNEHAAGEVFSRFAERVLEIHPFLQRADPEKGRFRDYLKAVLSRMVVDYYREQQRENKGRQPLLVDAELEASRAEDATDGDAEFQKVWIEELMNHAWKGLEQNEKARGQLYYSVLLYKAQNPAVRSEAMAKHFAAQLGKPFSAENVRKLLQRGQEMLSDLLVEEVARSLRSQADEVVSAERIEEELIHLQLLDKYRRAALDRYRESCCA
jgi:RNA polymerase sigma-70 factor (ECF subfamily)